MTGPGRGVAGRAGHVPRRLRQRMDQLICKRVAGDTRSSLECELGEVSLDRVGMATCMATRVAGNSRSKQLDGRAVSAFFFSFSLNSLGCERRPRPWLTQLWLRFGLGVRPRLLTARPARAGALKTGSPVESTSTAMAMMTPRERSTLPLNTSHSTCTALHSTSLELNSTRHHSTPIDGHFTAFTLPRRKHKKCRRRAEPTRERTEERRRHSNRRKSQLRSVASEQRSQRQRSRSPRIGPGNWNPRGQPSKPGRAAPQLDSTRPARHSTAQAQPGATQ